MNSMTSFDDMQRLAKAYYASNYFTGDVSSLAQVITKIMAGRELGLAPFASLRGIHIIKGTPVLSAAALSSLLDNHPKYDYKVISHTETGCIIEFFRDKESAGTSSFTIEDAKKAGLTSKDIWRKYPKAMVFARAMTQGIRWYAPGMLGGIAAYTEEEISSEVTVQTKEVIVEKEIPAKIELLEEPEDVVELKEEPEPEPVKKYYFKPTVDQITRLWTVATENKWSREDAKKVVKGYGYESTKDINVKEDYESIVKIFKEGVVGDGDGYRYGDNNV